MKVLTPLLFLISSSAMAQLIIEDNVKFLALGDSYTIGESVVAKDRWPIQLMDSISVRGLDFIECKIIAVTGWRTDNLKEAIKDAKIKSEYTLVSLLIGVNNYYQGKSVESYRPEFEDLLQTALKLAGGIESRVFVLSIPDYGYTPFGKEKQQVISKGIDAFNAVNESVTKKYNIEYINITDISRRGLKEPDLVAFDGLHPSGKMYSEWVQRILREAKLKFATASDLKADEDNADDDGK
jgi:lysophospholipase L1-like esterase